jgi:hypothetical protein
MMFFKHDPGDCPVDDAAHTTCTSPDYDPKRGIAAGAIVPATSVVIVSSPGAQPQRAPQPEPKTFTNLSRGVPGRKRFRR